MWLLIHYIINKNKNNPVFFKTRKPVQWRRTWTATHALSSIQWRSLSPCKWCLHWKCEWEFFEQLSGQQMSDGTYVWFVSKVINVKTKLIIIFQPSFNLDSLCIRHMEKFTSIFWSSTSDCTFVYVLQIMLVYIESFFCEVFETFH